MLILLILCSIFLALLIFHFTNLLFYWKRKNVKNSLKASTVENIKLFFLQTTLGHVFDELYWSTKEKYVGFFMLGTPSILVKDLKVIKRILVKDFDNFDNRTVRTSHEGDPLGTRIMFIEKNPIWKFIRTKISSSFSSGKMKGVYPQMNKIADNFVEYITQNEGKPVDLNENCPKYSTDVVTSCAFGVEENCFKNEKALSREASRRIFVFNISRGFQFNCCFISPFLTKLFNFKFLDPSASDFVRSMFNYIKEKRSQEGSKDDYVGTLIKLQEQKVFYTDPEEIVAQAAQFFLAGFETVSSTLTFALYEIANNQEVQDKLRKSIQTHLEGNDEDINYDSLVKNEYLQNVINETLRKYPILPFLDRKTKSDYYIPEDNLTIDAGTNVYMSLKSIHNDPKYFPNPMKFDPDRFSNKDAIVQNSYLPFGDGPRDCIGKRFGKLAVLTALSKIVRNFQINLVDDFEEVQFDTKGFLLAPMKNLRLIFHRI